MGELKKKTNNTKLTYKFKIEFYIPELNEKITDFVEGSGVSYDSIVEKVYAEYVRNRLKELDTKNLTAYARVMTVS